MWEYIPERVKMEAEYIMQTGATVRTCAAHFDVSKSTVHKDVTERLEYIDKNLWEGVRKILNKNLSERHIRGGIATKNKYLRSADIHESCCGHTQNCTCCKDSFTCEKRESMSCSVCSKACHKKR